MQFAPRSYVVRMASWGVVLGFTGFALLGPSAAASEVRFTAKVYPESGDRKAPLFNYKSEIEKSTTGAVITNTFTYPDGQLAALETTEVTGDGTNAQVKSYKMSQKQLGTEGKVEVRDGRAYFTFTKDGKTKTDDESIKGNFAVGPYIPVLLLRHWDEILKGETVSARLAVLDRLETIGFEFRKEKVDTLNGEKVVVIKMRPSSIVISAIVKPLYFYALPDGSKLREVHGRTHLKQKDGDKWKDLDAVTVYEFK